MDAGFWQGFCGALALYAAVGIVLAARTLYVVGRKVPLHKKVAGVLICIVLWPDDIWSFWDADTAERKGDRNG